MRSYCRCGIQCIAGCGFYLFNAGGSFSELRYVYVSEWACTYITYIRYIAWFTYITYITTSHRSHYVYMYICMQWYRHTSELCIDTFIHICTYTRLRIKPEPQQHPNNDNNEENGLCWDVPPHMFLDMRLWPIPPYLIHDGNPLWCRLSVAQIRCDSHLTGELSTLGVASVLMNALNFSVMLQ